MYRNIFELQSLPDRQTLTVSSCSMNGSVEERERDQTWTVDLVDSIALESDSEAIEYLSRHDFNLEEAVFSVYCEVGCGKGMIPNSFDNSHTGRIAVFGGLLFLLCLFAFLSLFAYCPSW